MATTYRIGPAVLLVADNFSDPVSDWVEIGRTSGGAVLEATPSDIARGRFDQTGNATPDAVWLAPRGIELRFELADTTLTNLLEFYPDAVRLTTGTKEALGFSGRVAGISAKAIALVPVTEYEDDKIFLDKANAAWFENCFLTVGDITAGREFADEDNAIRSIPIIATRAHGSGMAGIGSAFAAIGENLSSAPQGVQFAWEPLLDGIVPHVRDSYTFSRASIATYVDANGVVQTAGFHVPRYEANGRPMNEPQRTNLMDESSDLSSWGSSGIGSVSTDSTTAPDGSLAPKIIENGTNAPHYINKTATKTAAIHTSSFYAKAGTRSIVQLWNQVDSGYVNFDLATGTVTAIVTYSSATIEAIGGGWYRCSAKRTATAGTFYERIGVQTDTAAARNASYAGDGASYLYLWGFQLELGDYPTSYIPTSGTTATRSADSWGGAGTFTRSSTGTYVSGGVVKYAGTDEPRYQASGLLLEPQRTNLYSNSVLPTVSGTGHTIALDTTESAPDLAKSGVVKFTAATQGANFNGARYSFTITAKYVISWFVKAGSNLDTVGVSLRDSGASHHRQGTFTLTGDGSYVSTVGAGPQGIEKVGTDGWYRIWLGTSSAPGLGDQQVYLDAHSVQSATTAGDSFFAFGCQVEDNVSYPTSYIPTSGSSVTRSADSLTFPYDSPFGSALTTHRGVALTDMEANGAGWRIGNGAGVDGEFNVYQYQVAASGGVQPVLWDNPAPAVGAAAYGTIADGADTDETLQFASGGFRGYVGDTASAIQTSDLPAATDVPVGSEIQFNGAYATREEKSFVVANAAFTPAQMRRLLRS